MRENIKTFFKWILLFIVILTLWFLAAIINLKIEESKNERKFIFSLECRWKLSDEFVKLKESGSVIYKEYNDWYLFKANIGGEVSSRHDIPFYLYRGAHHDSKFTPKEKYYRNDLAKAEEVLIKQDTQFYYYYDPKWVRRNETAFMHRSETYFKDGDLYLIEDYIKTKKKVSYRKINRSNLEMTYKHKNGLATKAKCIEITEEEFYDRIIKAGETRFKF